MSSTSTQSTPPVRRDGGDREAHTVIPVPRRSVEDVPDQATSTEEWVTYPGVRYALERLTALRHCVAQDAPAPGDRA